MNFKDFCLQTFGNTAAEIEGYFLDIKKDLQKANMEYTLREYLSVALFVCSLTFFLEGVMLTVIFYFITWDLISSLLLSFLLSITIAGLLFFSFYTYPSTVAKIREAKIKRLLPFATSYLATIASGKMHPLELFKGLAQADYGEISKEARNIVRDVEVFGTTLESAIIRQAERTPSREFKELLWGVINVMHTGGDFSSFLKDKAEEMMAEYRRTIRRYSQDLALFVEIYLTLVLTGSIFFIVLTSVISFISGNITLTMIQGFLALFLLPGISIGFLILIKSISPL